MQVRKHPQAPAGEQVGHEQSLAGETALRLIEDPHPQAVAGIRDHRSHDLLLAVEEEGELATRLMTEGGHELLAQIRSLAKEASRGGAVSPCLEQRGHRLFGAVNVGLQLADCDRQLREQSGLVENAVVRVAPGLVSVTARSAWRVLLKAISVTVAVLVDPFQAALGHALEGAQRFGVAEPAEVLGKEQQI